MTERYDVAILGTGPAGLSAALTLQIRNKKILLIGSKNLSHKVEKAHTINNYLGLPEISGEELKQHFQEHLQKMEIQITEDKIAAVYSMGEYFALQGQHNQMYEAHAVILATGVQFGKPLDGEEKWLGRGVSYCATCDAPFYRGKKVAVIGSTVEDEADALYTAELAETVYYIPQYEGSQIASDHVILCQDKVVAIEGDQKVDKLALEGQNLDVDGVFILRESVSPGQLVPGLAMDGSHVAVNRSMETNLAGCFACGDITGLPYQYIKSAGEGNVAAFSAVRYLDHLRS